MVSKLIRISLVVILTTTAVLTSCTTAEPAYVYHLNPEALIGWADSQGELAAAPDPATAGMFYYDTVLNASYIYNGTAWNLVAEDGAAGAQGPQGVQGEQGPQGIQGIQGDPGAAGPNTITTSTSTDFSNGVIFSSDGDSVVAADASDLPAHAANHTVSGSDTVFPADPGADRYLMWDDDPGALTWAAIAGGGDMLKSTYDPNDDGVIASAQLDTAVVVEGDVDDTPSNGAATDPVSSNWAYDHDAATTGTHGAGANTILNTGDIDDTPADSDTSDAISSNWAYDHAALASSTSASGHIEAATAAETTTGTDATRAVTPDGLAGSDYGKRIVEIKLIDDATALATGDGKCYFCIPAELNGYNLVDADAFVSTVSSSGTPTFQIYNLSQTADFLTVRITIDANEYTSYTAVTGITIDTNNDDVATGDIIRIDKDVAGTGEKGDGIILIFQLP